MSLKTNRITFSIIGILAGLLVAVIFFADFTKVDGSADANKSKAEKVYVPYGDLDDYYMFASGGHSGQLYVYGVPSMRKIRTVPIFTLDSAKGYGYDMENKDMV